MSLVEVVLLWVAFSCMAGPLLAWAFFRQHRLERDAEEMAAL